MDEAEFQLLYGRWEPVPPAEVAALLAGAAVHWHIGGGRAARVGAQPRRYEATDVVVLVADLGALREAMAGWHLWEVNEGSLRPLLPGRALTDGSEQLWVCHDATQPWRLDFLLDYASTETEWVFKRDV